MEVFDLTKPRELVCDIFFGGFLVHTGGHYNPFFDGCAGREGCLHARGRPYGDTYGGQREFLRSARSRVSFVAEVSNLLGDSRRIRAGLRRLIDAADIFRRCPRAPGRREVEVMKVQTNSAIAGFKRPWKTAGLLTSDYNVDAISI